MTSKNRAVVSVVPASKAPIDTQKVLLVINSRKGIAFSTNGDQTPRRGIVVADVLAGNRRPCKTNCTIMVTVFRDVVVRKSGEIARPFDGGFIHVSGNGTLIEGLHRIYPKTGKMREFAFFKATDFRLGDRVEFDIGDCLEGCVSQFRQEVRAAQVAA